MITKACFVVSKKEHKSRLICGFMCRLPSIAGLAESLCVAMASMHVESFSMGWTAVAGNRAKGRVSPPGTKRWTAR